MQIPANPDVITNIRITSLDRETGKPVVFEMDVALDDRARLEVNELTRQPDILETYLDRSEPNPMFVELKLNVLKLPTKSGEMYHINRQP